MKRWGRFDKFRDDSTWGRFLSLFTWLAQTPAFCFAYNYSRQKILKLETHVNAKKGGISADFC